MNAQDHIKNDEIDLQADALNDLPVTDEQANQTRAGAGAPNGKLYVATNVGVF
jgi:hypothetical protein